MHRTLMSALALALGLSACAPFPEVAAHTTGTGPYPELQPIDQLLAQADLPPDPRAPAP
jgi:hypothetical protein